MKRTIAVLSALIMAASAAALASCGGSESSKSGGTVSLGSSDSSKAATASSADSSASEPVKDSQAQESSVSAESSPAESAPAESSAEGDRQPEVSPDASFKERMSIKYNGVTFYPGDKFADIKDKLGKEAMPSSRSKPCVPGAQEVEFYYYPGLTIQVNFEGTIINISVSEDSAPGRDASTAGGVKLGDTRETAKKFLGAPTAEDEYSLQYKEGEVTVNIYDRDNEGIFVIGIEDASIVF